MRLLPQIWVSMPLRGLQVASRPHIPSAIACPPPPPPLGDVFVSSLAERQKKKKKKNDGRYICIYVYMYIYRNDILQVLPLM